MSVGLSHLSYGGEWAGAAGGSTPEAISVPPVAQKPFPMSSKVLGCQPVTLKSHPTLPREELWAGPSGTHLRKRGLRRDGGHRSQYQDFPQQSQF